MSIPDGSDTQTVGRYVLYDVIASGGMASIHLGRQRGAGGFNKTVAIKRTHPHFLGDRAFVTSFLDEARLASRIQHPNVIPVTDVVEADGELLLVMEYVNGVQLSRLMRSGHGTEPVPPAVVVAIVAGALRGLDAAHDAVDEEGRPLNIVHRDVSPQNILVGADGIARILDFGIAKAEGRLTGTESGMLKGKLSYMAPEQLLAEPVSRRTDIYAMGVVLWEALTGKRFIEGDSEGARALAALQTTMTPPSRHAAGVPPELDAIALRAATKDAAERFASCAEMADALVRIPDLAPATHKEVSAWVRRLAGEDLARRELRVRDIESRLSPSQPDIVMSVANAPAPAPSSPSASEAQPETLLTYQRAGEVRRSRSRPLVVLMGAFAGLAVVVGAAFAVRARAPTPAPAGLVSTPASAPPIAAPLPSNDGPESAPETPPSAALSAVAPTPPKKPPHQPATHLRAKAPPAASAPTKKPPSCNPPYVLDADGNRTWKRECL